MAMPDITLIAAVGSNGVIGRDNDLPWRLSADLQRFKALTLGKPILMGRKTWDSLPSALPGRRNLVISRQCSSNAGENELSDGGECFASVDAALASCDADRDVMVIGGGQIYALAMPLATRLELTLVDAAPEGDIKFPEYNADDWQEIARETHPADDRNEHAMQFVTLVRKIV